MLRTWKWFLSKQNSSSNSAFSFFILKMNDINVSFDISRSPQSSVPIFFVFGSFCCCVIKYNFIFLWFRFTGLRREIKRIFIYRKSCWYWSCWGTLGFSLFLPFYPFDNEVGFFPFLFLEWLFEQFLRNSLLKWS